jgi:hypothetical protein
MFGSLFRPSCPCDPHAKAWVERRLQWLNTEFAKSAFTDRPMVLPTPEFFPDRYDGSTGAGRTLFNRVCEYMDVIPDLVTLEFTCRNGDIWLVNDSGEVLPQAAGTYEESTRKHKVRINEADLSEPMTLVGTMAHELGHVRLIGENRISSDAYDNELLTDLTAVFFGMGLFLANVPRNWHSQDTTWPGSSRRKPEYMTPPIFAYALAHVAWFRGEEAPAWIKHVRWAARPEVRQAIRYLSRTGGSTFKPERMR